MFRQVAAILLLIAFGLHTFQITAIVFDYYANTESFAKRCINKLRPSMHCNGKCLLMKKLKEEEKKDQQAPERKMENKIDLAFTKTVDISYSPVESIILYSSYSPGNLLTGHCGNIFHPPSLV